MIEVLCAPEVAPELHLSLCSLCSAWQKWKQ